MKDKYNPKNKIMGAIVERLKIAIREKQDFRVIILIPMHVAAQLNTFASKLQLFWQYATVCRGNNSLLGILKREFPNVDIDKYICFTSLRTFAWKRVI